MSNIKNTRQEAYYSASQCCSGELTGSLWRTLQSKVQRCQHWFWNLKKWMKQQMLLAEKVFSEKFYYFPVVLVKETGWIMLFVPWMDEWHRNSLVLWPECLGNNQELRGSSGSLELKGANKQPEAFQKTLVPKEQTWYWSSDSSSDPREERKNKPGSLLKYFLKHHQESNLSLA